MDNLFEINTKNMMVTIAPQALLMKPFELIWDRDKTKTKKTALKELTFVWGMASKSNNNIWKEYRDEHTRAILIKGDLFGKTSNWKPSTDILKAIDFYKSREPMTPMDFLLEGAETAMINLGKHLTNIDYDERNENTGALLQDPKKIHSIIQGMGKTVEDYERLKEMIAKGKTKQTTVRGGGEIGSFEGADSLNEFI